MGVGALRPALLLLLLGLLCGLPGAQGQACSVSQTVFQVEENQPLTQPLVNISVPPGQQVTLGSSSTPFAFQIREKQLYLVTTPDYESKPSLQAHLECRRGDSVVTQLSVFVFVLDINDNAPFFPFSSTVVNVSEDAKVNSVVIPETELAAKDLDKDDLLFYTLQEITPGASDFFSLVGTNLPSLKLDKQLDFDKRPSMTFRLLVRDTEEENVAASHTATATLTLSVLPADRRPPWFLPCSYSDGYFCIQAEYQGAVPTGHTLPVPLTLRPGPIYAVDGDSGIGQPIIYRIVGGNQDDVFSINKDSGNLTMTKSVSSPRTFQLLVRGEQADLGQYSVTRVSVEALAAAGSAPSFPHSLYHGTIAVGSASGTVVKDTCKPSEPLRVQAKDPDFPDFNSAITYRVTNTTAFRMEGETVVATGLLTTEEVLYIEVEAKNTVTSVTATTTVVIQVGDQVPTPGPSTLPTTSGSGRTTETPSNTTSEGSQPPEPSQGPSATPPSGGSTGLPPAPGTTLRPPASTTLGSLPSVGTSSSHPPATPSSGSSVTTPETSQGPSTTSSGGATGPHPPSGTSLRPPASTTLGETPGGGASTLFPPSMSNSGSPTLTPEQGPSQPMSPGPSGGHGKESRFSVVDMAALGGVLGALLLLALLALAVLIHKHHRHRFPCCSGKAQGTLSEGFDNPALQIDSEVNWAPASSPDPTEAPSVPPFQPLTPPRPASPRPASPRPASPSSRPTAAVPAASSPTAVRSILTKDRRPEGGYKAVWFGKDISAEADVVVLNAPTVDDAGDTGSEGSDGEDDSTYI
ncbi:cadherin-related family member 5 [Rhynchocyon petersi]